MNWTIYFSLVAS